MEDFQLLDSILSDEQGEVAPCEHEERVIDKGMFVCLVCGFSEKIKDGQTYTSHKMYKRASKSSSISSSLEQKGFDSRVIVIASQIYNVVVDENCKRTGNRNSISCACAFLAFKVLERPVDYAYIYTKFSIKKRAALKGLKIVNAEIAKRKYLDFHTVISSPIIPEHFILTYMDELKAPEESIKEVLKIYQRTQEYPELNMSRPQSIAAGIVYYWLKLNDMTEAVSVIERLANLSALTISKKAKVVAQKIE